MKHLIIEQCYMCSGIGNTSEHVPPKCIFPEIKDIGQDLRKNLIKVPSCRKHNNSKSGEDEFLLVFLASYFFNNEIGSQHLRGKVSRTLVRSAGKQIRELFINKGKLKEIKIDHHNSIIFGTPDLKRLSDIFETIAYGLYRHHFKQNFDGEIKVYFESLLYNDENSKKFNQFIVEKITKEVEGEDIFGRNPKVFFYQISKKSDENILGLRMSFYENFNVLIAYKKSSNIMYDAWIGIADTVYITTPSGDIKIR
ncbi:MULTISPECIES: hypothetical protein [Acinetobacter]|uniref:HNH endonuclease n=1 Tax=Acinetobacter chengduensis TaxID=2420890 RepID=A0ABX9TXL4_9GAMM|nr:MULTISPECIES: hypothetical protein [Acinetobacter]MBI1453596.1 hypothetical protein [Acinetobacter sp. FL51]RKG43192.1 hypothetical protein D7V31_04625 [Acinetobacter sp. WCHAc060007]RLL23032.1 hypothetical protein D9K81_04550 [Acinetobacter chengduensis]